MPASNIGAIAMSSSDDKGPSRKGLILPTDPEFLDLPPPPGSEPDLASRLHALAVEPEIADAERAEAGDPEPAPVVRHTVDAFAEIAHPDAAARFARAHARSSLEHAVLVQANGTAEAGAGLISAFESRREADPADRGERRGIAVLSPETEDLMIGALTELGVTALRAPMIGTEGPFGWPDLPRLAARAHAVAGWDLSLAMDGRYLGEVETMLRDVPGRVIIERFGDFRGPIGDRDPGLRALLRLIDRDKAWVSLAGPTRASIDGPPRFRDLRDLTRLLARAAPERLVWGSGWPDEPDPRAALARLGEWLEDDGLKTRILTDNAAELFGFSRAAPETDGTG